MEKPFSNLKSVKSEEIENNGEIKKRKSLEELIAEDQRSPRPQPTLQMDRTEVPVVPSLSDGSPGPTEEPSSNENSNL